MGRQCLIKEYKPLEGRDKPLGLGSKRTYDESGLEKKSKEQLI